MLYRASGLENFRLNQKTNEHNTHCRQYTTRQMNTKITVGRVENNRK